jgi:hypothetical protein
MNYIKCLRRLYSHAIPKLESVYDECKFENSDLTFNELIIQYHFNHLREAGCFNAGKILKVLPKQYRWIVRKFLKHEIVKKVPVVRWGVAKDYLKDALTWNWENDEEVLGYIQEHSPVRHPVCV